MHKDFFKQIERYLNTSENKKVLILNDTYYSFNATNENILIEDNIDKLLYRKNIRVINTFDEFNNLNDNFEIIINIYFSTSFINQLEFYNKILEISVLETRFISFLPFLGFVNYGPINFNPTFFNNINAGKNFAVNDISFIDKYGKILQIKKEHINKIFFQTTEKGNQSFVDHVYNEIKNNFTDTTILLDININKLESINFKYFIPERLGHHLSGHGSKTWIDEGAFKKLIDIIEVKTMIDVGCGPGGMIKYSKKFGIKSIGVDGDNSIIRDLDTDFFLHDYTKGIFEIDFYFDLCWCVEFLEHVEEKYASNYFNTFAKCKYVFCTFAPKGKGGYHHVNLQNEEYWINMFEKYNFKYDKKNTEKIRLSSTIHKNFVRSFGLLFKNKKII